jgi:hypothetical protein
MIFNDKNRNLLINISPSKIRDIINLLYFKINAKSIFYNDHISEYDVQEELYSILKLKYANKNVQTKRELSKVDIVLSKYEKSKISEQVYFEIKTYIKPSERLSILGIDNDIDKLVKLIKSEQLTKVQKKGIMIVCVKQSKLNNLKNRNKLLAAYFKSEKANLSVIKNNLNFPHHSIIRSFFIGSGSRVDNKAILNQIRVFAFFIK